MIINPLFRFGEAISKPQPNKIFSGNSKKCKTCKHFESNSMNPCYNGKFVKPKSNACSKYESKSK